MASIMEYTLSASIMVQIYFCYKIYLFDLIYMSLPIAQHRVANSLE
jgi:hypothetical protein